MKYTSYNKGLEMIDNYVAVCKEKYNTTPEIKFSNPKPIRFNETVGYVVEIAVNIKKFTVPNNTTHYIKGHRFIIETNTTYMPDDYETLKDWGDWLNYTLDFS